MIGLDTLVANPGMRLPFKLTNVSKKSYSNLLRKARSTVLLTCVTRLEQFEKVREQVKEDAARKVSVRCVLLLYL